LYSEFWRYHVNITSVCTFNILFADVCRTHSFLCSKGYWVQKPWNLNMLIVGWHYLRKHKIEMTVTWLELCGWRIIAQISYMIWRNNFLSRTCINVKSQINLIFSYFSGNFHTHSSVTGNFDYEISLHPKVPIPNFPFIPQNAPHEIHRVPIPNFPFIPQNAPHEIRPVPIPNYPLITPRFWFRISPLYPKMRLTKFIWFRFRISPT
jgi:hypothetical protein